MSGLATVGLFAIGVAVMMMWTNNDLGKKQAGPAYRPIEYEVLSVRRAQKPRMGSKSFDSEMRVYVRFIDPFTEQTVENYSAVSENDALNFHPGEHRKGLFAPQWIYPVLDERPPDVQPERNFTRLVAIVLSIGGMLVLLFAWKTGRLFK